MRRLPGFAVLFAIQVAVLPLCAKTLKDSLVSQGIPITSFSQAELAANVQEVVTFSDSRQEELAYTVGSDINSGPVHVIAFNKTSRTALKTALPTDPTDVCSGSLDGIMKVGDFTLISTDISPSAQCVHVLDEHLAPTQILYGFGPTGLGVDKVVFTENMIHFAPVHPERLQLTDLRHRTTMELYPPSGDALRAKLARANAEHMPSASVCAKSDDPCDPKLFDEDIAIAAGGNDHFALVADQLASHALAANTEPVTFASQWVLYLYARAGSGWLYCEREVTQADGSALALKSSSASPSWFGDVQNRCTPSLPVAPDMSTAIMNPFQHGADPDSERQTDNK